MNDSSAVDNLDDLTDEALMMSYQEGNAAAFDVLYTRNKGGLYRYVLRQLNNQPDIANEIFQDIWLKLVNARLRYKPTAKFTTYLYHLAHNRLVDYWRSEKNQQHIEYEDSLESESAGPHSELQHQQVQQEIKQAIALLPEEQRSAILLKEEGLLSLAEIAEITGVNRETVKSRLRYAVKRLQGILHPLRPVQ